VRERKKKKKLYHLYFPFSSGTQFVADGEYEPIFGDTDTEASDSHLSDDRSRRDSDDDDDSDDNDSDDSDAVLISRTSTTSSGGAISGGSAIGGVRRSDSLASRTSTSSAKADDAAASATNAAGMSRDEAIARYRVTAEKLREAKSTIASLIDQITDYQSVMEGEKEQLEVQLKAKDAMHAEEKKLMLQLLDEAEQKQEKQNAETMKNLSTLMVELENIEEHNNTLSLELDAERETTQKLVADQITATTVADELRASLAKAEARIKELEAQPAGTAAPVAATATATVPAATATVAPPLPSITVEQAPPPLPLSPRGPATALSASGEAAASPRRPQIHRGPTFTQGLATVATGVPGPAAETTTSNPETQPLLSDQDLSRMTGALDDFLKLPRAQQARMYAALYNAAQRARVAAPFVARLASAFGHQVNVLDAVSAVMAVPGAGGFASGAATPARHPVTPGFGVRPSERRRSFAAPLTRASLSEAMIDDIAASGGPESPRVQDTPSRLGDMAREIFRAEQQNRSAGMATLRSIPKEAGERLAMLNPEVFATARARPNLKRGNRTRAMSTQVTTEEQEPVSPGLPPDRIDHTADLRRGTEPTPVKAASKLGVAAAANSAGAGALLAPPKSSARPRSMAAAAAKVDTAAATSAATTTTATTPAATPAAATPAATQGVASVARGALALSAVTSASENEYDDAHHVAIDWYEVQATEHAPTSILAVGTEIWVGDSNGAVQVWDGRVVEQLVDMYAQLDDAADETPAALAPKSKFTAHAKAVSAMINVTSRVWTAGKDGVVTAWTRAGKFVCRMEKHKAPVTALVHVPQQKTVWSAALDQHLVVWDAKTSKALKAIKTDNLVVALCLHNDDVWVGTESAIAVYNDRTYERKLMLKGHTKQVHSIVSVDPQTVWSCSEDMTVCIWTSLGIMRHQIKLQAKLITLLAVERHVWIGDRDGHIVIYDTNTCNPVDSLDDVHTAACSGFCLAPVPDSRRVSVWSGSADRALVAFVTPYSFDAATGRFSASSEVDPKAHDWLKAKFKSTTVCKRCKHDIWSLVGGRAGLVCRKCKIAVHKKCALDLESECVVRRGAGSAVARKSMIQRQARRTVQFDPAVGDDDPQAESAPPSLMSSAVHPIGGGGAASVSSPSSSSAAAATTSSAASAASAAAATVPATSATATTAASPATPGGSNDGGEVMNEALRLRDAEGQSMTRRRSDSNPILLAAGLRESSQRSNTVARLSPVTARRAGETPRGAPRVARAAAVGRAAAHGVVGPLGDADARGRELCRRLDGTAARRVDLARPRHRPDRSADRQRRRRGQSRGGAQRNAGAREGSQFAERGRLARDEEAQPAHGGVQEVADAGSAGVRATQHARHADAIAVHLRARRGRRRRCAHVAQGVGRDAELAKERRRR
jgi:hypothetical protein